MPPGLEGVKQLGSMLYAAFPDRSTEIHHTLAEDDRVAALHTIRGTHSGDFIGMPPTGKSFEVTSIHIARVADGKVAEHWGLVDQAGMMRQLGMMPTPPGAESWRPPPTSPQVTARGTGNPQSSREHMDKGVVALQAGKVEDFAALIDPDVVDHAAMPGQGPGRDGVLWRIEQMFSGMTDPNFTVEASVGEGSLLAQAYTFTATHTGPMMGMPPTNKPFRINAIDFVRVEDGLLREHWAMVDVPGMMMQLGLMPPPG
jgi:predicted ester cyclase